MQGWGHASVFLQQREGDCHKPWTLSEDWTTWKRKLRVFFIAGLSAAKWSVLEGGCGYQRPLEYTMAAAGKGWAKCNSRKTMAKPPKPSKPWSYLGAIAGFS